jgi:hypothetical protein
MNFVRDMQTTVKWVWVFVLTVITCAVLWGVFGCTWGQRVKNAVDGFKDKNPNVAVLPVDVDKDGVVDFIGVDANNDNVADVDEKGNVKVVPGSREPFDDAKFVDVEMSEVFTSLGLLFGVPGVGLIGKWWGRRKPMQKFTALVSKFEEARVSDSPKDVVVFSRDVLDTLRDEQPEIYALVRAIRMSEKTKNTETE